MTTHRSDPTLLVIRVLGNMGFVAIAAWFLAKVIAKTQADAFTASKQMALELTGDLTSTVADAMGTAASGMATGISHELGLVINDAVRDRLGSKITNDPIPHYEDRPATTDDPTQGEGDTPWFQQPQFANDGGPLTRPIDWTDNDWPDPVSDSTANRVALIPSNGSGGIMGEIHATKTPPGLLTFGADGFPTLPGVGRPDLSGEGWEE